MSAQGATGAMRGGLLARRAAGLATAALAAFALRALHEFDPTQISRFDAPASEAAFFSATGNAPFFVYAVAAWLFYERRARFFAALGSRPDASIALASLGGAVAFAAWATHTASPDLLLPAASLALVSLSAWLGGRAAVRAAWISAIALLALVPIPAALVNEAVLPLQLATADVSAAILRAIGIEAVAIADRIVVRGEQVFQVIESCSGLRSTQTIALSALLYGAIFARPRTHWIALVALAPPLGLIVNELRVLSLIFNPYSSFAAVHEAQGLAMLVVGVLAIALVDALLARALPGARVPATRRARHGRAPLSTQRVLACTAGAAALALATLAPSSPNVDAALAWDPSDVPLHIDDYESQPLELDRVYMGTTRFRADTNRRFTRGDATVDAYLGVLPRSARTASVLSPKPIALATQRPALRDGEFRDADRERAARAFVVATREGPQRVWLYTRGTCSLACEAARSALALDRSGFARAGMPYVVRLATPVASTNVGEAQADARLLAFADALDAALARLDARSAEQRARDAGAQARR